MRRMVEKEEKVEYSFSFSWKEPWTLEKGFPACTSPAPFSLRTAAPCEAFPSGLMSRTSSSRKPFLMPHLLPSPTFPQCFDSYLGHFSYKRPGTAFQFLEDLFPITLSQWVSTSFIDVNFRAKQRRSTAEIEWYLLFFPFTEKGEINGWCFPPFRVSSHKFCLFYQHLPPLNHLWPSLSTPGHQGEVNNHWHWQLSLLRLYSWPIEAFWGWSQGICRVLKVLHVILMYNQGWHP